MSKPKTDPFDDYELSYQEFFSEIPGTLDYLNTIDPEIQDEHVSSDARKHGLSDEQINQIARDSLEQAGGQTSPRVSTPTDPQLFTLLPDDHKTEH